MSVSLRLKFEAWVAGASPKIKPVTNETRAVKRSTLASIPMACACEMLSGMNCFRIFKPTIDNSNPKAPPKPASKRLSVRN